MHFNSLETMSMKALNSSSLYLKILFLYNHPLTVRIYLQHIVQRDHIFCPQKHNQRISENIQVMIIMCCQRVTMQVTVKGSHLGLAAHQEGFVLKIKTYTLHVFVMMLICMVVTLATLLDW